MPYHGSVYAASALYCVRYGVSAWQKSIDCKRDWDRPMASASGTSSTTSQLSVIVLPVFTPPCR